MRSSYLDYAMSVIVGRALPDVRDGLKPVHRRVLFSMNENGLQPNRAVREVRPHRRRRDGQVPPARRQRDLRRAGAPGAGLLDAQHARRRPGQLRLDRRGSGSCDALLPRGQYARRPAARVRADRRAGRGAGTGLRARRELHGARPPRSPDPCVEGLQLRRSPDTPPAHARGLRDHRHPQSPGPVPGRRGRRPDADVEAAGRDQARRPGRHLAHAAPERRRAGVRRALGGGVARRMGFRGVGFLEDGGLRQHRPLVLRPHREGVRRACRREALRQRHANPLGQVLPQAPHPQHRRPS